MAAAPRVWVLLGARPGDNAQLIALAEALGWGYETKQMVHTRRATRHNLLLGASLAGIDRARSSPLAPPWPDLVLTIGRRNVPAARWIRAQAGGTTKLVHLGRPWAPLRWFDFVVTTAQYGLPPRPNVLHSLLPLNRPDPGDMRAASERWAEALQPLPRPWTALLVGGASNPYRLDGDAARRLAAAAEGIRAKQGGSLLVTTSPRTPQGAAAALWQALRPPLHRHAWAAGTDSPYLAYLAGADRFIVTGDSASMLAEACRSGRPVHIFELPMRPSWKRRLSWRVARRVEARRARSASDPLVRLYDAVAASGVLRPGRDLRAFHAALIGAGLARPVGDGSDWTPIPAPDEMARTVARVRALFDAAQAARAGTRPSN